MPTIVTVSGSCLMAVPAVHFRVAFAERVNQLCSDPQTRPDAIAVELGPQTASAAAAFLRDLGMGPSVRKDLPCMLGLTRPNRTIRASFRPRAIQLQEITGKDLSELPPELLNEALGYSS